ncbi:MAG TPA: beta-propeller domain-containing protein [Burkholderiaceae bacterium]|nr:beta-propeller domain-containing protein [Burkholderiaceae bacterium]
MSKSLLLTSAFMALAATVSWTPACANPSTAPRKTLTAFASEQELVELVKRWADEIRRRQEEQARRRADSAHGLFNQVVPSPSPASPAAKAAAEAESVTNVQHAGVDEGGIVKLHGEHLIILRRGRLFTVRVGDGDLKPVSSSDAFGPDIDPRGAWYDEMLVSGNTIAVIGYSYARGGTEVGVFEISSAGRLTHKGTYHLRSNDYYSSRNYASRLIGTQLVVYSPLYLNLGRADPFESFPAVRKWRPGATPADFKRIAPATRIYRTDEPLDPHAGIALHSVSICDLAKPELDCESTAVLGPAGRVFYVSPNSVFVWATSWRRGQTAAPSSSVFRIPLDGSAPSALKVAGSPIDQFSFLEGEDGMLNVLVRSNGRGDGMWAAETNTGDLALLRVALSSFSDGKDSAPPRAYRSLPKPAGHALQSRYIGAYLLYGAGTGWHRPQATTQSQIYAVRYAGDRETYELPLPHAVDRIEALGSNAVVVGSDGKDLHLTSLRLARFPVAIDRYTQKDATQGETRSHGFYYKPDNPYEGLLGLPIVSNGEAASRQLRKPSAALLYLRNSGLSLSELGTLDARPGTGDRNDGCRASCVDWYGNSRPLFLRGRVFALMGYEIVEGAVTEKQIVETRRVSFAPAPHHLQFR